MSFRNVQSNDIINSKTLKSKINPSIINWVRNPTWAAMPSITSSNEEVDILVAVYPESNFIGLNFSTSSGTYHIDWGDGTTSDTASGTQSDHQYTFSTGALANTDGPVTFQDSGDTVTRTAHGYTNGMQISFATIVTTTGITALQKYYVISATANTFQLSSTQGGTALALTTDGSGTILQFKQAIIKVTCNTGGATLTTVNMSVKNATTGLQSYINPILDITISANCSTLTLGGGTISSKMLERCTILRHNTTSFSNFFNGCSALQSVPLFNTASVVNMGNMFQNCYSLQSIPLFNTSSVTSISSMFNGCSVLQSIPLLNTALATDMTSMFNSCFSLQSIPLFNTASVTNMSTMFSNCKVLQTVPLLNTASVTNMSSMFSSCFSLQSIPLLNTASVTNMSGMFSSCSSLQSIPLLNTASVTNMSNIFVSCSSLQSIPLLNTASVTDMSNSMFGSCSSLQSIPLLNTASVTNMSTIFQACFSLQTIPLLNTASLINAGNMFLNCSSVQQIPALIFNSVTTMPSFTTVPCLSICNILGISKTVSFAGCKLSGTQLDNIYTNLTAVGGSVTFTDAGDIVTMTSHGFLEGSTISFSAITTTTGIVTATTYYVRNPTSTTFQLATTKGGSIINLVNNGTGTITASAQTITVTSNWGIATDTPTIATTKGWTVTGS